MAHSSAQTVGSAPVCPLSGWGQRSDDVGGAGTQHLPSSWPLTVVRHCFYADTLPHSPLFQDFFHWFGDNIAIQRERLLWGLGSHVQLTGLSCLRCDLHTGIGRLHKFFISIAFLDHFRSDGPPGVQSCVYLTEVINRFFPSAVEVVHCDNAILPSLPCRTRSDLLPEVYTLFLALCASAQVDLSTTVAQKQNLLLLHPAALHPFFPTVLILLLVLFAHCLHLILDIKLFHLFPRPIAIN